MAQVEQLDDRLHLVSEVLTVDVVVYLGHATVAAAVEQARNEDGVWLVTHDRIKAMAKVMLAVPVRVDETDAYTGYRKYQAESRIVTDEGK